MYKQSLNGTWTFRDSSQVEWNPANVPGSVHLDLMKIGQIPDPFVGENEEKVQWVIEKDWEYQSIFNADESLFNEEHQFLKFEGIDTLAEVYLNDELLGSCDNMFRTYEWNVSELLNHGENQIRILFPSLSAHINSKLAERYIRPTNVMSIDGGPYVRKAPCQFGWDWGPKLPPIGIWKDVILEGRSTTQFKDIQLEQHHSENSVKISAILEVHPPLNPENVDLEIVVIQPDGKQFTVVSTSTGVETTLEFSIENPELWFPNGYGSQPLYQLQFSILSNGKVLDRETKQIGLRTIELLQEPDEWGKSFTFVVNGIPIFAKGSDWIPADSFPTRTNHQRLEKWIKDAALSHQNMLRVWGGGFYETEDFYDLCDQYGILVWQDFVFACYIYPLHQKQYLENVKQEVFENVRRIRHRASLALWCGNNEMEWGWESWNWDNVENSDLKSAYDTFFHYLLPNWLEELDPNTDYWPSSPSSNTPFKNANSQASGDAHYWDVWHQGAPFTAYRDQYPRFMSEFGFQAFPPMETIKEYAEDEDQNLTSYVMESHQKNGSGNRFIINQMTASYRIPNKFENLIYMSLVLQAEGIRYGVEHWRRNMHRVSGTLYWQLNDCWPVASWASIDYFGRWKALHYAAKRFYAPVLLSLFDDKDQIGIHISSDLTKPTHGEIKWELITLDGQILDSGNQSVEIAPLKSEEVFVYQPEVEPALKREVVFTCELIQNNQTVARQLVTFVPDKHIKYTDPELDIIITEDASQFTYTCTAKSLARYVELKINGVDTIFSDNYFDVSPNQSVTITSPKPENFTLVKVKENLEVMHLYKSFTE